MNPESAAKPLFPTDPNYPAALLHELWGGENEEVVIEYQPTYYGIPHTWRVDLISRTDSGNAHHADWCEHRWSFYDESLWTALTDAVAFATDLRELSPDDE